MSVKLQLFVSAKPSYLHTHVWMHVKLHFLFTLNTFLLTHARRDACPVAILTACSNADVTTLI